MPQDGEQHRGGTPYLCSIGLHRLLEQALKLAHLVLQPPIRRRRHDLALGACRSQRPLPRQLAPAEELIGLNAVAPGGKAHSRVRRQGELAKYATSVCMGAFLLGAAGLLKGVGLRRIGHTLIFCLWLAPVMRRRVSCATATSSRQEASLRELTSHSVLSPSWLDRRLRRPSDSYFNELMVKSCEGGAPLRHAHLTSVRFEQRLRHHRIASAARRSTGHDACRHTRNNSPSAVSVAVAAALRSAPRPVYRAPRALASSVVASISCHLPSRNSLTM